MSGAHTPGPWSVTDNNWETSTVYGPDGETVAECPINSAVLEDSQHIWEPVKEANAKLIAGAPEMLGALKKARDHIRAMQDVVAGYLPPDSGVTEHQAMNGLIYLLDGPEERQLMCLLNTALGESDASND